MSTDNLDKLNATFRLKAIRREGAEMLKGQERKKFEAIGEKLDKQRTDAEQLYRLEYKIRVDIAYRELRKQSDANTPKPRPPILSRGRATTKDLHRQAQTNVRFDHQRLMDRLDVQELKDSEGFLEKSSQRKTYLEAFKSSTERRRTETRRESPERRRSQSPSMSD